MTGELSPKYWANRLTKILNASRTVDRFPVQVKQLALDFSHQLFPKDSITTVIGDALPGFEGALLRAPAGKKGWGIIYNKGIRSRGRINFTLAHEFGHYLVHRQKYPDGMRCGEKDMAEWDLSQQVESEANDFAATLLMPFDDFRKQIGPRDRPAFDVLEACKTRYGVSMTAAILRWLQYTERRAVLVVSREGFILWAWSSEAAWKTGAIIRTRNRPPVEIPAASLAAQRSLVLGDQGAAEHDESVWLQEPCQELVLFSDQYDYTITLLHLGEAPSWYERQDRRRLWTPT